MKRWLWLCALPAIAAAQDAGQCEWKEMRKAPEYNEYMGGVELVWESDPAWWQCVKRGKGGELKLEYNVGQGGELTPFKTVPITSWNNRETLSKSAICQAGPGLKQVQATLTGAGTMEKIAFTSNVREVFCEKCPWSGADNMYALHTGPALTPPGTWTLQATFDPEWHKCANPGSKMELHLFTGDDRKQVQEMKEPTHIIKGFEGSAKLKKSFPKAAICKGKPKYVGTELRATGELQGVHRYGRSLQEVGRGCP